MKSKFRMLDLRAGLKVVPLQGPELLGVLCCGHIFAQKHVNLFGNI